MRGLEKAKARRGDERAFCALGVVRGVGRERGLENCLRDLGKWKVKACATPKLACTSYFAKRVWRDARCCLLTCPPRLPHL